VRGRVPNQGHRHEPASTLHQARQSRCTRLSERGRRVRSAAGTRHSNMPAECRPHGPQLLHRPRTHHVSTWREPTGLQQARRSHRESKQVNRGDNGEREACFLHPLYLQPSQKHASQSSPASARHVRRQVIRRQLQGRADKHRPRCHHSGHVCVAQVATAPQVEGALLHVVGIRVVRQPGARGQVARNGCRGPREQRNNSRQP
jgi:hypothetical protein